MTFGVLIVGAGGHGQVVADILQEACRHGADAEPVGFLDDDRSLWGQTVLGLPVLGAVADLPAMPHDAVIVAIGDNAVRWRLLCGLRASGVRLTSAVHPSAVIAQGARLGAGVAVCAGVIVNTGSIIGDRVILNTACTVDHHNCIGDCAHIAPGAHLAGRVVVGEGALVGIGSSVTPGRRIGQWATVGAGAVVIRDVPAGSVAVGVPARVRRLASPGGSP